MIAPGRTNDATEVHLAAPPNTAAVRTGSIGRTTPSLLCAASLPHHATLVCVGDEQAQRDAARLGLHADHWVRPTIAKRSGLERSLRRAFPDAGRVVCWADELAPLALSLGVPCELVSTKPGRAPARLRRGTVVRVVCDADRTLWNTRGVEATLDESLSISAHTHHSSASRDGLRRGLGIAPTTLCLGAFEDDPSEADARQFAFLLGLLSVAGYEVVGMLPENAARRAQAVRHHIGLGRPFRMLWTDSPLTDVLPVLDACVINPGVRDGSTLLLERLLEAGGVTPIDLSTTGPRGFSRSQRIAAKILDRIDGVVETLKTDSEIAAHA